MKNRTNTGDRWRGGRERERERGKRAGERGRGGRIKRDNTREREREGQ